VRACVRKVGHGRSRRRWRRPAGSGGMRRQVSVAAATSTLPYRSVPVPGPQPLREPEHELDPLELGEPLGGDGLEQ